jgi:hypothetical protein
MMRSLMNCTPHIFWVIKSRNIDGRNMKHVWGRGEVYVISAGKPEGKESFGRTRLRWDGNIKIDLQEVGCAAID